jgi:hypothetical protein
MVMMKNGISVLLLVAASGCATTSGYQKHLASFNGAAELDVVRTWGAPQQAYEIGERKFLSYSSSRNVIVPTAHGHIGNTLSCQTTFEIDKGVVVGSSWKGNDCRAR